VLLCNITERFASLIRKADFLHDGKTVASFLL